MQPPRQRLTASILLIGLSAISASVQGGGTFRTEVTKVLHTGDPAPGVPGAVAEWLGKPQITGDGAVAFEAFISGPGVNSSNDLILYFGQPGELVIVCREGDPVPHLPAGVTYDDWEVTFTMGEDGTLSVGAILAGPGVIPEVNDKALLVGKAGDLQLMARAGDPAPGFPPEVIITTEGNFFTMMTDDGRFLTRFHLSGPGIDPSNNKVYWAVDGAGWHQIVRTGDPAPGTEPGVTFSSIDMVSFNDSLEIAFRGGLTGDPIHNGNNSGLWSGGVGVLELVSREGDPAPLFGGDVILKFPGSTPAFNALGDVAHLAQLEGPGITQDNDILVFAHWARGPTVVVQEGDIVPEVGPSVEIDTPVGVKITDVGRAFFGARLRGPGIKESNDFAFFFGSYPDVRLVVYEGDSLRPPLDDLRFGIDGSASSTNALNDIGGLLQTTYVTGPGVTSENNIVLFIAKDARVPWVPVLRKGDLVQGRTFTMDDIIESVGMFWHATGGSEGLRQSLNDNGLVVAKLRFTDGTLGVYRMHAVCDGDWECDGDVDFRDFGSFQSCFTGPGGSLTPGCEGFDFDQDNDVDLIDFDAFLAAVTGPVGG